MATGQLSAGAPVLATFTAVAAGSTTYPLGPLVQPGTIPGLPPIGVEPSMVALMVVQFTASVVGTSGTVYFQHSLDGGTTWDDFIAVQVTTATTEYAQWQREGVFTTPGAHAKSDGALAANTVINGPTGADWRMKLTVVGTAFTGAVRARQFQRR